MSEWPRTLAGRASTAEKKRTFCHHFTFKDIEDSKVFNRDSNMNALPYSESQICGWKTSLMNSGLYKLP